jgi:phospholipase C
VHDSLTANPARWGRTVMIYTYDEHGGFFDHVPPLPIPSAPRRARPTRKDSIRREYAFPQWRFHRW